MMATIPPPARKRPPPSDVETTPSQTPQSRRRRMMREYMPVTPVSIPSRSAYVPSPRADALDALAAIACTTSPSTSLSPSPLVPHSPSLLSSSTAPTAPAATSAATSNWLARLVESRPEVANFTLNDDDLDEEEDDDDEGNNSGDNSTEHVNNDNNSNTKKTDQISNPLPKTTPSLNSIITRPEDWAEIVQNARRAVNLICQGNGSVSDPERYAQQANAVYYAAVEGLLQDESVRLRGDSSKLSDKLIRNQVFHKSIMAFSWECAVAANGRLDMRMLWMAMLVLQLTPFALTKVLQAFVKRFKDMPQPLRIHLMNCDARIVERRLWIPGSELVNVLSERAINNGSANNNTKSISSPVKNEDSSSSKWVDDGILKKQHQSNVPSNSNTPTKTNYCADSNKQNGKNSMTVRAKEVVLQMVYKKVLALASLRAQELLLLLSMDNLAEDVWSCFKACVWQHWHIMVSRHLDQVIMCCIYGVAKVHRVEVKFREIVAMYRTMKHIRDPSFTPLLPDVIRQVSLTSFAYLVDKSSTSGCAEEGENIPKWGDLIQFYNKVFIPSMKKIVLKFGSNSRTSVNNVGTNFQNNNKQRKEIKEIEKNNGEVHQNNCTKVVENSISSNDNEDSIKKSDSKTEEQGSGESYKDSLRDAVLQSPLRSLKTHGSVKRIGRVTVGPMSPRESVLVSLRQSPGRRSLGQTKAMTPGTRTLYAFGESPGVLSVRSKYSGNNDSGNTNGVDGHSSGEEVQRQLSFDARDMKDPVLAANLRKRVAGAFAGMNGKVRIGGGGKETSGQQRRVEGNEEMH